MNSTTEKIFVCGAGIAGMFSAYYLKKSNPNLDIVLIDKSDSVGGLLKSFQYENYGIFDVGIHTLYQTGIDQIDEVVLGVLEQEEWSELPGDIGGTYVNGILQTGSPYIDLRNIETNEKPIWLGELLEAAVVENDESDNALEYLVNHFGNSLATKVMAPILEKVFKTKASELNTMAVKLLPMNRIVAFDDLPMQDLMLSSKIRSRVAIPNQRNLKEEYKSNKKGFYPKKLGLGFYVKAFMDDFLKMGGHIWTNSQIAKINISSNEICSLNVIKNNEEFTVENVKGLCWGAGLPVLSWVLDPGFTKELNFDPPLKNAIVNVVTSKNVDRFKDLQYVYVLDGGYSIFRVAIYKNYCPNMDNELNKISLEILYLKDEEEGLEDKILQEMINIGIVDCKNDLSFFQLEKLTAGVPRPTQKNISSIRDIRNNISAKKINNLICVGSLAEDNLYFQSDILKDALKKLKHFANI
ncbi:MAG: hypothetical protein COW79_06755 [Bdellovibrionales bacterium CG22_combo_CG10-13_8_21_14_all_38_13]|nr:MAG: hypothetical protein COW79_06755 [Bdellovibrionales bacterium CG22_combo_CG10-13_8_21_14_all_38_13]